MGDRIQSSLSEEMHCVQPKLIRGSPTNQICIFQSRKCDILMGIQYFKEAKLGKIPTWVVQLRLLKPRNNFDWILERIFSQN